MPQLLSIIGLSAFDSGKSKELDLCGCQPAQYTPYSQSVSSREKLEKTNDANSSKAGNVEDSRAIWISVNMGDSLFFKALS